MRSSTATPAACTLQVRSSAILLLLLLYSILYRKEVGILGWDCIGIESTRVSTDCWNTPTAYIWNSVIFDKEHYHKKERTRTSFDSHTTLSEISDPDIESSSILNRGEAEFAWQLDRTGRRFLAYPGAQRFPGLVRPFVFPSRVEALCLQRHFRNNRARFAGSRSGKLDGWNGR